MNAFMPIPSLAAAEAIIIGGLLIAGLFLLIMLAVALQYVSLYIQAATSQAHVGFFTLIAMKLRHVQPQVIVQARIRAVKAGLDISIADLETHYMAGGRVPNVVSAMIAADRAQILLPFKSACAIDLAGRDILDAVHTSVNPKVIDCPDPRRGRETIDAVSQDGIQLKVKARITVRTNIAKLVGGATEETIIARVGEGIVTTIGSSPSHKAVLENPDTISKKVLEKGLDAQTAFQILSVDIADVDVGENIGAKLQADQAAADAKRFQAEAEKRRSQAIASEQEFKAEIQRNRAQVVLAEAEIPKAMAEAFRNGNLGIMDYYKMKNVMADTDMRKSIAGEPQTGQGQ